MPHSRDAATVGGLPGPSVRAHEPLHHEEWEISSSTHGSGSNTNSNGRTSIGNDEMNERITLMLKDWEQRVTQVITKWGDMGVKSAEYSRNQWREAMEKKEEEKIQRQRAKNDEKRRFTEEYCARRRAMSARAEVRRTEKKAQCNANAACSESMPPRKPRQSLTSGRRFWMF
ncbi:hypothetical protein ERJ75_000049000 [Trypanosoma vivax]|uniref:Uncharacterized protein n=1 Tax=Trypanosoma vivax (strain Y486) TaxID=1055687 RepID=G0U758_TRYVY|nr:hypothetical protein TRVL_01424 [Trypanosoma vivax]KAH8620441.1 hypothetical protein ERJ75_000049000 [Trypanosoma vivax]CCC51715.1 conserved hypothetical protein [Trypanosoma vivax Y486]